MFDFLKNILKKNTAVRYLAIGGSSYLIELCVLLALAHIAHLGPVLSVGISFWVGLIISFLLQKFIAFNNRTVKVKHLVKQSILYGVLVAANYLFTLWFVGAFNSITGLIVSRTIALIITTLWNYFLYKYVLFTNQQTPFTIRRTSKHQNKRGVLFITSVILGVFLIGYVTLGIFSRPMADDLIFLNGYGVSDFAKNLHDVYTVNGRFTTLTVYLLGFTIPIISELTALLTMLIVGFGLYLLGIRFFQNKIPKDIIRPVVIFSTLSILCSFAILTPSPPSSIFWFSAAVVHIWSYGFILMLISYYLKLRQTNHGSTHKKRNILIYSIITMLVALFGEMPAITIIAVHAFTLLVDFFRKNKQHLWLTLCGLAGGIIAFAWLYFAPASVSRRHDVAVLGGLSTFDFIKNLPKELYENITLQLPNLYQNVYILILVFFIALLLGLYLTQGGSLKRRDMTLYLIVACLFIAFHIINISLTYVAGGYIPLRIYAASSLGFIIAAYLFGYLFGYFLKTRRELYRGIAIGTFLTLSLLIIVHSSAYIPWSIKLEKELHAHAAAWDVRDEYIKDQINHGVCQIKTISLPIGDIGDINKNPNYWINKNGMENYYQPPSDPNYWNHCSIISAQ